MWSFRAGFILFIALLLLISWPDRPFGGVVTGQLYTVLEDVAEANPWHKFAIGPFPDKDDPYKPDTAGSSRKRTCIAKYMTNWDDQDENTMEEFQSYRFQFEGSNQPHYFCSNMPKFDIEKGPLEHQRKERLASPHARFWLDEATAPAWRKRWERHGPDMVEVWQDAKNLGLIFKVAVTGIRSRGRFLKGWYHLKIEVELDHNLLQDAKKKQRFDSHDKLVAAVKSAKEGEGYLIDKLIVTARGRTIVPGRPHGYVDLDSDSFVRGRPRRAWVGGIGEFVQDFPRCEGHPQTDYVTQQFMPCGTLQYSESKHGNNFYYSRNHQESKYGKNEPIIHVNFRLDNSFCNRYYDLDFVANGIVRNKKNETFAVLRSISTRFVFASSYAHHYPEYYENADPIPRHVSSVDCSHPLQGEWRMSTEGKTTGHRMSITRGADLKLTGARPDATFHGAIKFVFPLPPTLLTQFSGDGRPAGEDAGTFNSRRTWTYPIRFFNHSDYHHYYKPILSWNDVNSLPQSDWMQSDARRGEVTDFIRETSRFTTLIQRVANEFDWETWLETAADKGLKVECDMFSQNNKTNGQFTWPHPYYDVTCGGINVVVDKDRGYESAFNHALVRFSTASSYQLFTEYEDHLPPITGRCAASIWFNDGLGRVSVPPPKCDEWFTDVNEGKFHDPALKKVMEIVKWQRASGRRTWVEHYILNNSEAIRDLTCELAEALWVEYPQCISIPPRPYTPRAPYHVPPTKEEQAILDWEARKRFEHRQTKAYLRGMLISENPYTLYIWDSRLIHGCFMTIIALFVTPVSIFMTRYFKETFMDTRIFLHHVWYFVHVAFSLATLLGFMVGMWRQLKTTQLMGVSLGGNGLFHRVTGWSAIALSLLFFAIGGLRSLHKRWRAALIIFHAAGGFIFYGLCLGCMLSSIGIPGSPATYNDYTTSGFRILLTHEAVFIVTMMWIFFDIIMHVVMTVLQCKNDKRMLLTEPRAYFLSPMPVIAETYRFDTPGRFKRIYLLWVYIITSFIATSIITVFMYNYSPRGRGLGFMSCTHTLAEDGYQVRETMPDVCCQVC